MEGKKRVEDIMVPLSKYPQIKHTKTLAEAIRIIGKAEIEMHGRRSLPRKILVFDEATSSLDSQTERAIQQTLADIARDHTTMVIAHRLSTVINADLILVVDNGQIVARGTHQQLLQTSDKYRSLQQSINEGITV